MGRSMIDPRLPGVLQMSGAALALASAEAHAVGGPAWIVTRTSGNGIDEDVVESTHTINPCWIYLFRPAKVWRDGEWFQPDDEWRFAAPAGTNVQPLDQVQSALDATKQFTIMTVDRPPEYLAGLVESITG